MKLVCNKFFARMLQYWYCLKTMMKLYYLMRCRKCNNFDTAIDSLLKCFKKQIFNSIISHRINVKYSKIYNNKIPHAVMGYNNVNEMYARFLSQDSISLSDYRATWNSIYLCKINSVRNRICTQCNEEKMVNLYFALFSLLYI